METGGPSGAVPETVTSEPVTRRLVGTMPKTGHSTEGGRQDADEHLEMSTKHLPTHSGEDVKTQMPNRSSKPGDAPFSSVSDHVEAGIKDSECNDSEREEYNSERNRSEREVDTTRGEQDSTRTDDPGEQSTEAAASEPLPLQRPPPDGDIDEDLANVPINEDSENTGLNTTPSAEMMTRESVSEHERSVGGDSSPDPPTRSPPPTEQKRAGKDPSGDLAQDPAVPSFSMGNELQYPTLSVGGGRVSVSTAGYVGDELWM